MIWLLTFMPRRWLQRALMRQWRTTLLPSERHKLTHWGATGNPNHHDFQWADDL